MIEEKLDRIATLLEKLIAISTGTDTQEVAKPKPPKKEKAPETLAPAAPAVDPFATTEAPPAPTPAAPVDAATLGAALVAYSKTAKTDEAGYALVAELFSKYKTADGKTVTKRSELQVADYNAVFEAAKKGTGTK